MENEHLIEDWREAWKAEADENERLRAQCIELLGALRGVLDNPLGGYEQAEAYFQARSRATAVAERYAGSDGAE